MFKKLFIVFVLLLSVPAQGMAADKWSKRDLALEATYQVLNFIDWRQTRTIAKSPRYFRRAPRVVDWKQKKYIIIKRPDSYREINPLLGRHPSTAKVNALFIVNTVLHPMITHYLPKKYRVWWQGLSITVNGAFVAHNFSIGIKMDF